MKTVIDAVNFYQGEWRYHDATSAFYRGAYWYCGSTKDLPAEHVCTREEFNQCVEELSTNFGESQCYAEYKHYFPLPAKQVYTQAMADNGELPSVGMECMYKDACTGNYIEVEVLFINEWSIVLKQTGEGYGKDVSVAKHVNDVKLKPIDTRTDKEKAIEEYIVTLPPITVNEAELIKKAFDAGVKWVGE